MVDTPSSILLLRLQSTGSNTNLWGGYLNTAMQTLEQASKGFQTLAVTGDATITWTNYATGNIGQCAHLGLTGTLTSAAALTFPSTQNWMLVHNNSGATVTVKCSGGTGVAIPNARRALVHCNATDYFSDTPTWTGDSTTLTNNGDITNYAQVQAMIAAASIPASAGTVLITGTDATANYIGNKTTITIATLTTTQVSGLTSFSIGTKAGTNQKLQFTVNPGYVGGYLPGGNKSSQFTPVVGTEYNCDFSASSWTINIGGMTTPQIGQRFSLNCFGNFQPFMLGTVNGQTNIYADPGFNGELEYSSASWGWN